MIAVVRELGAWLVPLMLLAATAALVWVWLTGRPRLALLLLLAGLPLHTVAFQVASVYLPGWLVSGLRLWREALLLALCVAIVRQWSAVWPAIRRHWPVGLALVLYAITLLVGVGRGASTRVALSALRLAAVPLLVFACALAVPYGGRDLERAIPWLLGVGVIVCGFALYQGYVLGPGFLWTYYAQGGRLAHAYEVGGSPVQRLMGTFSSPNQLSLYLVFLAMISASLFMMGRRPRLAYGGLGALYVLVLVLTVSRSGWAALAVGGALLLLLWWHRWEIWAALAGLGILGLVAMAQRGLLVRLRDLVSLQEVSAAHHVSMAWKNLQTIASEPWGSGLGSAGPLAQAAEAAGLIQARHPTESYLLQIGLQQGWPGLAAFGLLIGLVAAGLLRGLRRSSTPLGRAVTLAALACLAGAVVHGVMNVDLQDIGVQSYLWFLVAMGLRMPGLEHGQPARGAHA